MIIRSLQLELISLGRISLISRLDAVYNFGIRQAKNDIEVWFQVTWRMPYVQFSYLTIQVPSSNIIG